MEGMRGREVWKAAKATAAHTLLLTFTIVLVLKLHIRASFSWWFVFSPLWLFHAVVYRGRFSIPAPSNLDVIPWDPFHSVVAMPLLIAFELLLCVYLESSYVNQVAAVNLEIVFLPVFLLETIIIIENLRMCCPLVLAEIKISYLRKEFTRNLQKWVDDVGPQLGINLWITVSMAATLPATVYLVQMIIGNVAIVNFWEPYLLFSFGQVFALPLFLSDISMHDELRKVREGSSSTSALVAQVEEDKKLLIGGHIVIIILIVGFQILLCMYVTGTPARAREIPIPIVFSPLFLLQGVGVLFSTLYLVERIAVLLLHSEAGNGQYLTLCSRACDFQVSIGHGLRCLGWWSIDDGSREVDARRLHECESGCNAFCGSSPDIVKKMPKKDLVEEVCTLQAAINEQIQLTGSSQQEYERLQFEKVLCIVCFQRNIGVVLLPCRHRILCRTCGKKCSKCPMCRVSIVKLVCSYYV